jgi:DNA polymerase V
VQDDLVAICREVRARVLQWVGLPTCVGIGPTKTLAKLANHIGKSAERKPGSYPAALAQVCHLGAMGKSELDAILAATAVGEVWGVGKRIGAQLVEAGVMTVLDLVRLDPVTVRRRFSVVLEKTVRELQGMQCIELDDAPPPKQQIMVSRSFGHAVTRGVDLATAITEFTSRAAEKLRNQQSSAGAVVVFIRTSPFRADDLQYSGSTTVPLVRPTADSAELVASALTGLRCIYRKGYRYAKAGVMLVELQSQCLQQFELDWDAQDAELPISGTVHLVNAVLPRDRTQLMTAMDEVNRRYGRGSLQLASAGVGAAPRSWSMKQERKTPRYTTEWDEMPIARA